MWTCRNCKAKWEFSRVTSSIDNEGIHFICPACSHRNILIGIRSHDGFLDLMQPDIEWPSCHPYKD